MGTKKSFWANTTVVALGMSLAGIKQSASRTCGRKSKRKQRSQRSLHSCDDLKQMEQHVLYFCHEKVVSCSQQLNLHTMASLAKQAKSQDSAGKYHIPGYRVNTTQTHQQQLYSRLYTADPCAERVGFQTAGQTERRTTQNKAHTAAG